MFLKIGDHTLHAQITGSDTAPPLVLLHSLGTSGQLWQAQIAELARTHRVICPDFRGHGLSELSRGPLTVEALAEDVLALLAALGVSQFALAGISLGGVLAQLVAAEAGARVTGLALFDSYVVTANPAMWRDRAATVRGDGLASIATGVLSLWISPEEQATPEGAGMARMLAATSDEGYAAGCDALAAADNRARIASVTAPSVVACGENDRAAPPAAAKVLADALGGARVEVIEGAAHIPLLHHSSACTAILRSIV